MTPWISDELNKIEQAEELQIASLRRDSTLRNPVTIWVVRVGDDLYVRAWFRGTQARHEGHIRAGGVDKNVTFVGESDSDINNQIDTAYRTKYQRYAAWYVDPMVTAEARAAPTASAGLSWKASLSEIDQNLKRLGMGYVDMYQIHRWDHETPIAGKAQDIGDQRIRGG